MSERVKIGSTPILNVWYLSPFKVFFHFPHSWKHFAREHEIRWLGVGWFGRPRRIAASADYHFHSFIEYSAVISNQPLLVRSKLSIPSLSIFPDVLMCHSLTMSSTRRTKTLF